MTFYGYFRSSAAYRCRIAFNIKGFNPKRRFVHLTRDGGQQKSEAYRSLSPQGLVPALDIGGGTVLIQSLAIIEWLDETHPGPPLLPRDPIARAQVRAFAQIIACDIHPLQNLRVLSHLRGECGLDQEGINRWCRRWLSEGLAACEVLVARNAVHKFSFGDSPGLADICLVPQLFSADRFGVDLKEMPRLRAIRAACEDLPAFSDAHPTRQIDTEA
jgi:maleylacetoacetate isomerase